LVETALERRMGGWWFFPALDRSKNVVVAASYRSAESKRECANSGHSLYVNQNAMIQTNLWLAGCLSACLWHWSSSH
jgi:hypothetical protein